MTGADPATIEDSISIMVEEAQWRAACANVEGQVTRAARKALSSSKSPKAVNILLTSDAVLKLLNRQFRGQDKATNVLSFPALEMPGQEGVLGDIALGFETVAREAIAQDKALGDHMQHLVIHGVLHLLGHDHEIEKEADEMERLEARLLSELGIADPYRVWDPGDKDGR